MRQPPSVSQESGATSCCAAIDQAECCERERSLEAWEFLKARLKELGLSEAGRRAQDQGELPPGLPGRSDRGGLSRRRVVPRLRSTV